MLEAPLELETLVACPLCHHGQFAHWATIRDHQGATEEAFTIVRCRGCDLLFLNPRPSGSTLALLYGAGYGPHTEAARANFQVFNPGRTALDRWKNAVKRDVFSLALGYPQSARPTPTRRLLAAACSRAILRRHYRLPRWRSAGRVLEIGCGRGHFLEVLRDFGWRPTGLEWDEEFARSVSRDTGIPVLAPPDSLQAVPDETFDAVVLWHVLEHVPDPIGTMREVRRVLRRGGELRLEVPNSFSVSARMLKPFWPGIADPRHLFHFSRLTLAAVLASAGWTQFRLRTIARRSAWSAGFRHRTELRSGAVPERPWFERRAGRAAFSVCSRAAAAVGAGEFLLITATRTT